ncbi:hypothetical protein [Anaerotignum sp.]|nr:hypothetical protein [Anaerotignum sp.]MBQ7758154.1 hypothetical protein [Anaerotignum sp.]
MPQFIDEEKKDAPQKGEMLRQAAVVVFLLLGVLLKNAGVGAGAVVCFVVAVVCAINWILFVKKQKNG